MTRRLGNVRPTPRNDPVPSHLTLEQALQHIYVALPHLPEESRVSFLTMAFGPPSSLPSHEVPAVPTTPLLSPLVPDALHGVVQAKTYVCRFSTFASI